MVHTIDIVVHSIGVGNVVLCGCVGEAGKVTKVVRFAEVVPCEDLDDVGLEQRVCDSMKALGKESVGIRHPRVGRVAIVEIFELPWRDG